jgi:general secretion pathway protein N
MNASSQRRLTPILAILVLLLGAFWMSLLFGFGRGVRWEAPRAEALSVPSSTRHAELSAPLPPTEFMPVWQQSLFSPDRRPEVHATSGGSNLGDLKLTGIILTPQLRMALLHDASGDKELRVREGQPLPDGSATVVEIKQRSVILDSAQGRTELKLLPGAPIDATKAANVPTPLPVPPGAGGAPQPGMPFGPGQPRQADQQPIQPLTERLRKFKAAIQQRRAASQAANQPGVN